MRLTDLLLIVILIFVIYIVVKRVVNTSQNGTNPTEELNALLKTWINYVTVDKNPAKVAGLFCKDGILVGTVSQTLRKGPQIENYFDYFAKIEGLKVLDVKSTIDKVTSDVYVNNAFITWQYTGVDPFVARMTFLYRRNRNKWCIYELHSSALPERDEGLKSV